MGFADWKKRSEAFANVMTYSVPTRSNILRALQAAYKAGERDGRKQVEALAYNGARLAVMVEREPCAKTCEALNWFLSAKARSRDTGLTRLLISAPLRYVSALTLT